MCATPVQPIPNVLMLLICVRQRPEEKRHVVRRFLFLLFKIEFSILL